MKYLIAGLGNAGPEYELTRHNIGFLVMDRLADKFDTQFDHDRLAYISDLKHRGRRIYLIKPTTYMNLSGRALNYWMQDLKIKKENILVVADDTALPYGSLRMRAKGSSAGHNGLRNIEQTLGSSDYARLKFGVGSNFPKGGQVDYVLSHFSEDEMNGIITRIDKACEMILSFCSIGIQRTMNQFND